MAVKSTPRNPAATMRLTALPPAPPTPITRSTVSFFSSSISKRMTTPSSSDQTGDGALELMESQCEAPCTLGDRFIRRDGRCGGSEEPDTCGKSRIGDHL